MKTTDKLHPDYKTWSELLLYCKSKKLKEGDTVTLILNTIKYLYSYDYIKYMASLE